jgi:hypothetical protein
MKVTKIAVSKITTDAGTQTRTQLSTDLIAEYAEAMKSEDADFPAVIVFSDKYILADGFHRVEAAKLAGIKDIDAEVMPGSRTDALRFALSANATHGLKRSPADKRHAVKLALMEWAKLANIEIAAMCAVSEGTVREVRAEMESTSQIARLNTRIGKDGKERKLPVPKPRPSISNIPIPQVSDNQTKTTSEIPRLNPAPAPKPKKLAQEFQDPNVIKDDTGMVIPEALLPIWNRRGELDAWIVNVRELAKVFKDLQESEDPLLAWLSVQSVFANLSQALADLKGARLHAVCPTCLGKQPEKCGNCRKTGFIAFHNWSVGIPQEQKEMRKKFIASQS